MAVVASQLRASLARLPSPSIALRSFSSQRWTSFPGWSLADEASEPEESSPLARAVNQVYLDYRFQILAPSWLPFHRESSFFMPPSPPFTKILEQRSSPSPLSVNEIKFALNPLGWASSEALEDVDTISKDEPTSPELQKAIMDLKVVAGMLRRQVN